MSSTQTPPHVVAACNQEERLVALRRYGILDTEPEPAFDDITRLVAHVCQTPMATITFVDRDRQWFKSEIGMGVRETPLDISICAHAILRHDLLIIHDTLEDERFRNSPIVTGKPHLRFYAGARLTSPDGQALGTLCVLDYVPRSLTAAQQDALRALARQVVNQLELRQALAAQVAAAEALEAAKLAAEEANRTKDHFLAALSHELRTPLSSILLWANILRHPSDPAQFEEGVAAILASAKMQKRLIEDLLDTSRIVARKLHLNPQEVAPVPLVREALDAVLPAARAKGVTVETDIHNDVAAILADPDRLRQICWNLFTNAVNFTPAGGRIRITLSVTEGMAQLRVADSGQGISAEFLPHVFDAFRQADRSGTRHHGGLGLGLSIAKNLVDLHGGTLDADSPGEDQGATFTVRLPLRASPDAAPVEGGVRSHLRKVDGQRAGGRPLTGTRILVVEDDPATRTALVTVLSRAGAAVTETTCAAAALRAFDQSRPDVLLSDIGLPDTDGYGLIRRIRQLEATLGGRTPAVAVTAYAGGRDHTMALEAGFDTHLPKPADPDELVEVVAHLAAAIRRYE